MPERFTKWDVSDYLETPEDVVAYLDAWLEDGTAQEIAMALGDIARSKGMTEISRRTGLNRVSLYTSLGENGNPSFDTVLKVIDALGYRLRVERKPKDASAALPPAL